MLGTVALKTSNAYKFHRNIILSSSEQLTRAHNVLVSFKIYNQLTVHDWTIHVKANILLNELI